MDVLKSMKDTLMCCAQGQMAHLETVDAKELGEVIDMIKDLEEAIYYCTVVEAMKGEQSEQKSSPKWQEPVMYYGGNGYSNADMRSSNHSSSTGHNNGHSSSQYSEYEYPYEFRDYREGRSPHSRRMYMEAKEAHQDKATQMRELEKYMQELTSDIVEMVEGASPEEKQYLSKRVSALANKLAQLND
jgi:hypothetical protein